MSKLILAVHLSLSSSSNFLKSSIILLISSLLSLSVSLVIVILLFIPVVGSKAVMLRSELASTSKVISIWSCPFGFLGRPLNSISPNKLFFKY